MYKLKLMLALAAVALMGFHASASAEALASWNDGPAKKAILEFVKATTEKSSPKFVPPEERIATFDQDGTLWVEHPVYGQTDVLPRPRACAGRRRNPNSRTSNRSRR